MQTAANWFPDDYDDARRTFVSLAAEHGFILTAHVHPSQRGPRGQELACDTAWLGPVDAKRVLLISSGTHGVEGYCGSGCQAALLRSGLFSDLHDDTAVLLVHAVNPYGFAWLRRTNEDNVDLNRNFIDHRHVTRNTAYDEIHNWLVPPEWQGPQRAEADANIDRYIQERGLRAFQVAMTGGQYHHPDGLFYGGTAPSWSNRNWRQLLATHCGRAEQVYAIDIHSGLGPSGVGEAISATDRREYERACAVFGADVKWTGDDGAVSAQIGGSMAHGSHEVLGPDRLTMIALEYGTYPIPQTLEALRAETWLVAKGTASDADTQRIKQALLDVFYVNEPAWKRAVVDRCLEVVGRVRASLQ